LQHVWAGQGAVGLLLPAGQARDAELMSDATIARDMAAALREILNGYDHGQELEERDAVMVARALGAYERAEAAKSVKVAARVSRPRPQERIAKSLAEMFGVGEEPVIVN
jgi:hypothetical protein